MPFSRFNWSISKQMGQDDTQQTTKNDISLTTLGNYLNTHHKIQPNEKKQYNVPFLFS
ncbi:hypothetical protein LA52FAK_21140 [Desulforhopalus sp. 52FAK]